MGGGTREKRRTWRKKEKTDGGKTQGRQEREEKIARERGKVDSAERRKEKQRTTNELDVQQKKGSTQR